MSRRFIHIPMVALCLLLGAPVHAWEYEGENLTASLDGYLQAGAVYALKDKSPDEDPTTELGLEFRAEVSDLSAIRIFLQAVDDGTVIDPGRGLLFNEFNRIYQDKNPYVDVDEAYVDLYSSNADLRIGIQKFAWGRLDEINPTDNLNPEDFRQGIVANELERKIGVPAVKVNAYSDVANVELAWIPWFVPYRLPTPEERWFPGVLKALAFIDTGMAAGAIPVTARHEEIDIPAFNLDNSQAGIRVSKYVGGWDLSLSYFRGYDPTPLTEAVSDLTVELQDPLALDYDLSLDLTYEPSLHRIQVFGFDFATTVSSFTIRGEFAYFKDKFYNRKLQSVLGQEITPERQQAIINEFMQNYFASGGQASRQTFRIDPEVNVQMDSMKYGLGIDYIYGDTSISMQVIQEWIPDYDTDMPVYFNKEGLDTMLTLQFKQFFLQNTMEFDLRAAYGIEFRDYLVKPSLKYNFTETLQGTIGLAVLGGRYDDSLFGQFEDNDEIYAQIKCFF
ncbi:MAG TPA: hypothetical protein P5047_08500 [Desulfomonilia bacterium]|jgi:hypothetical protein|nr:hypothetical protein [Deltaproteobacteria bacterium]HPD22019.1 hypothetical protein [Deltaproteobacteria bacterium]HRS56486.1 hypothetical protein [Desulfomonilia bacterium]HRV35761.1 hypothetical protein [Desulfomonilia bacterium]